MIFAEIFDRKCPHLNRGVPLLAELFMSMILKSFELPPNPKSPPGSEDTRYKILDTSVTTIKGTETVARDSADCAKPWLH